LHKINSMTETNILDSIPVRRKEYLLEGNVCTDWLPVSVERRAKHILADDERSRFEKPRLSDIYRAYFKEGVKILSGMDVAEIKRMDADWSEECRKMASGFDSDDNLALFSIGQQSGIRRDSRLRRIAVKLGCDSLFGE
jgi:hypothetical protein